MSILLAGAAWLAVTVIWIVAAAERDLHEYRVLQAAQDRQRKLEAWNTPRRALPLPPAP